MNNKNSRPHGITGYMVSEEIGGPAVLNGRMVIIFKEGERDKLLAILKDPSNTTIDKVNEYEIRIVCEQGVGYKVTHQKPWRYSDYAIQGEGSKFHSMWELVEQTIDAPEVDLAEHIAVFGARLEGNFHQHYWWATTIAVEED
jgi:hypothetical protein